MAAELSKVLDHVERIRELDLERVPPTSHVVDVSSVLRADEPVPCLPRERGAGGRAGAGRRGLRRPKPGRDGPVSELIELTAAAAAAKVRAREIDPAELFEAYRERAAADDLNAFTWVADATPRRPEPMPTPPLGGVPGRGQGPVLHRGRAEPGRLADPRGLPAAVHRDGRGKAARRRGAAAGQDQPGRVRDGLLERELGLRARAEPVGPRPRPGRLLGRQRRRGRRRTGAVGDRHRHRRLDPPARRAVRHRRRQADLRGVLALRDDRVRLLARPGRAR